MAGCVGWGMDSGCVEGRAAGKEVQGCSQVLVGHWEVWE